MRFLHTSDWHLGRALYRQGRKDEFAAFLQWMLHSLTAQAVELLVIAGDVFDTVNPPVWAQELYYDFLSKVAETGCRHVIVIAGNHDAASVINAPRSVLQQLPGVSVWVVGAVSLLTFEDDDSAGGGLEQAVHLLHDADGQPEAIVCAVPFLRDRDLRRVETGEEAGDKEQKLIAGITEVYRRLADQAELLRQQEQERSGRRLPVLATGHLFAVGGSLGSDDSVRDLYVGSLAQAPASVFPPTFDYVALGHLHSPQRIAGQDRLRYSGAPLVMSFQEASAQKYVILGQFDGEGRLQHGAIELLEVPKTQRLARVKGSDWAQIDEGLCRAAEATPTGQAVWIEVIYEGLTPCPDLFERIQVACQRPTGEALRILSVRNQPLATVALAAPMTIAVEDLSPEAVFALRLARETTEDGERFPEEKKQQLLCLYQEVLHAVEVSSE